jgi:hypothetical protein
MGDAGQRRAKERQREGGGEGGGGEGAGNAEKLALGFLPKARAGIGAGQAGPRCGERAVDGRATAAA